jgi:DNA-binding NarL/FixJ family response regulator
MENESFLSPRIATIILDERKAEQNMPRNPANAILKENELCVLKLLVKGLSAGEIAQKNNVNLKTVEAQRRRIMIKLNIDNFADLVKYAIREDITTY